MPGNTSDNLSNVLEAKGVKFNFHTGGVKYQAILHKDRPSYERTKGQAGSADSSVSSTSSTDSESSAGSKEKAAN